MSVYASSYNKVIAAIKGFFTKNVKPGEMLPRFYGFGSYNFGNNTINAHPIGLNLIVSGAIAFYYGVVISGFKSKSQEWLYKNAFATGQLQGQDIGYHRGYYDAKMNQPNKLAPELSTDVAKQNVAKQAASVQTFGGQTSGASIS